MFSTNFNIVYIQIKYILHVYFFEISNIFEYISRRVVSC